MRGFFNEHLTYGAKRRKLEMRINPERLTLSAAKGKESKGLFATENKRLFFFLAYRLTVFLLTFSLIFSPTAAYAQSLPAGQAGISVLNLPVPGTMVSATSAFAPTIIRGVNIHPEDPLMFDFIIDKGESGLKDQDFEAESKRLIKYFMAALTTPEEEMWVNLSPYEKNRIIPDRFGQTEMGRDLLAQDYLLKQLSSSLMYPEDELGRRFWDRVHAKAYARFGTTEIPMNTFNKIWIVPQEAKVYEHAKGAFIITSRLKVMLEEDYLALRSNAGSTKHGLGSATTDDLQVISGMTSEVIKEVLIPEIEREVNEGETFANLRQIYNSVILASWYKQALKNSLLGQVYVDQGKTKGVDVQDAQVNQKIYKQYLTAFKTGVYNYIKEDYDAHLGKTVPRKYFSGGAALTDALSEEDVIKEGDPSIDLSEAEQVMEHIKDVFMVTAKVKPAGVEIGRAVASSPAKVLNSRQHKLMKEAFDKFVDQTVEGRENDHIFSWIRAYARRNMGSRFNEDEAENIIIQIKNEIIRESEPVRRSRIVELLKDQSGEYIRAVDGFGTVEYDIEKDDLSDLETKEQRHEDMLFASKQAVDALGLMGETEAVHDLIALANKGLAAHRAAVGLTAMLGDVERAKKGHHPDLVRRTEVKASSYYEAIRRWMTFQNMLMKSIGNLGLKAGENSKEYQEANRFLIDVMLDHDARGEAYYWMRQQGAYRLKDYDTEETVEALDRATDTSLPEGATPHESTIFIAMNLEAANPKSLTIGLAAGMSKLHIQRVRARHAVVENPDQFDYEQKKYQFVRIAGVLDALISEEVDTDTRVKILNKLAGVRSETAFALNFLLDAIEEIVKGARDKNASIYKTEKQHDLIRDARVRKAALDAFMNIAKAVELKLSTANPKLQDELKTNLDYLAGASEFNQEFIQEFRTTGRQVHVTLGNLHRLSELESFAEGEEYLNLNRKIIITSGGGASVAMSGVIDRITQDPALSVIGTTDNGGATLMVRAFEAIENGTFVGGFGDHVRFIYEAAVLERAPGALIIKSLLNHRFGDNPKSLVEELKGLYGDGKKKARQSGPKEYEQFEKVYQELLKVAAKVDATGIKGDHNSVKNMVLMGLLHETGGTGKEFMNPDGIYAAFEHFRRLLGAKSMAVPDNPIGNEIIVISEEGEEFYGQSFYSHTPRGLSRSNRKQSVLKMKSVDVVYPEVAIRSRIMGAVRRARLVITGLGSWGTSIGILLKNASLVNAIVENPGDKLLITNPVTDDETRGMSWFESTVTFSAKMMGRKVASVFNGILANKNDHLDRDVMTARPQLKTIRDVYDGKHGGYAGANSATEEDIDYFNKLGVRIQSDINMATVELSPQRTNPDLYNANIQYVPELFAEGLIRLMSPEVRTSLTQRDDIGVIRKEPQIVERLKEHGLSLLSLGLNDIHEIIAYPDLVNDLKKWIENDIEPEWIKNKRPEENVFQYTVRSALEGAVARQKFKKEDIALNKPISLDVIDGVDVQAVFLDADRTDKKFKNRTEVARSKENREAALNLETSHRLGIVSSNKTDKIVIELPYDLLHAGTTLQERIARIQAILSYQIEKSKLLHSDPQLAEMGEHRLHQSALKKYESLHGGLGFLPELSIAIPYMRYLRKALSEGKVPNTFKDMDGTFTAAGTALTPAMAYNAYKYHKTNGVLKTVMTAQQYEGPHKQIIEPTEQIERRLRLAEVLSDTPRRSENKEASNLDKVTIAVSSGGAIFIRDEKKEGYVKEQQESMDPFTIEFIRLAARLVMPEVGYAVDGHQIELREPLLSINGEGKPQIFYAAMAILPSGRYDAKRDWDLPPKAEKRNLMAARMAKLLEDPQNMLNQVELLIEEKNEAPWRIQIGGEGGEMINVLEDQKAYIKEIFESIRYLLNERIHLVDRMKKPINISSQPGGSTTLDIAPEGKGPRIPGVVTTVAKSHDEYVSRYTKANKIVRVMSEVAPTAKGPRIPGIEEIIKEKSGISLSDMALSFLGDEISVSPGKNNVKIYGNDFTVAEEEQRGNIDMEFIAHVGPTGGQILTLDNTTTAYGEEALMPNEVVHLLNYTTASVQKGRSVDNVMDRLENVIGKLGSRTWDAFGIKNPETMNEREAEELSLSLNMPELVASSPIITSKDRISLEDAGPFLPTEAKKGGIDLNPNHIDMLTEKEKGIGLQTPVVLPEQVKLYIGAEGFHPVIINIAPVGDLPWLLGLHSNTNRDNQTDHHVNGRTVLAPIEKRDRYGTKVEQQISCLN